MFSTHKHEDAYSAPKCEVTAMEAETSILDSSFVGDDLPTWGDDGVIDF